VGSLIVIPEMSPEWPLQLRAITRSHVCVMFCLPLYRDKDPSRASLTESTSNDTIIHYIQSWFTRRWSRYSHKHLATIQSCRQPNHVPYSTCSYASLAVLSHAPMTLFTMKGSQSYFHLNTKSFCECTRSHS